MGYRNYTSLMYGVFVPETDAKSIAGKYYKNGCFLYPGIPDNLWVELISDGTDSRAENLHYEPGYMHYLGIVITDDAKDLVQKIQNPPADLAENFAKYVKAIMDEFNIKGDPSLQTYNQTI